MQSVGDTTDNLIKQIDRLFPTALSSNQLYKIYFHSLKYVLCLSHNLTCHVVFVMECLDTANFSSRQYAIKIEYNSKFNLQATAHMY